MNRTFYVLLISVIIMFVFEVTGNVAFNQSREFPDITGKWELEQAEYIIHAQDGSIESKIYRNDFGSITACETYVPKTIIAGDIVQVETPFGYYYGRASWEPIDRRYFLKIGVEEDLGKETPVPGLFFNICNLDYLVEIIDSETILIETKTYCKKDSVKEEGIIKCFLRKK